MRDLLERLPGALMPDPRHESDDPGVSLSSLSPTPLVAPLHNHRVRDGGDDSPLLQHVRLHIPPFDARHGLAMGLRLQLAGATIVQARVESGYLCRRIGAHCRGQSIPDAALAWLQVSPFGGLAATIAVVRAAERILAMGVETGALAQARDATLSFAALGHHLDVLSAPVFAWTARDERSLRRLRDDLARELAGLMLGAPLAQPYALSRPLDGELQAMTRLAADARRWLVRVPDAIRAWSGIGVVTTADRGTSRGAMRSATLLGPMGASLGGIPGVSAGSCTMTRLWHRWREAARLCDRIHDALAQAPTTHPVRRQHRLGCARAAASNGPLTAVLALEDSGLVEGVSVHAGDVGLLPMLEQALSHTDLEDAVAVVQSFGIDVGLVDG